MLSLRENQADGLSRGSAWVLGAHSFGGVDEYGRSSRPGVVLEVVALAVYRTWVLCLVSGWWGTCHPRARRPAAGQMLLAELILPWFLGCFGGVLASFTGG